MSVIILYLFNYHVDTFIYRNHSIIGKNYILNNVDMKSKEFHNPPDTTCWNIYNYETINRFWFKHHSNSYYFSTLLLFQSTKYGKMHSSMLRYGYGPCYICYAFMEHLCVQATVLHLKLKENTKFEISLQGSVLHALEFLFGKTIQKWIKRILFEHLLKFQKYPFTKYLEKTGKHCSAMWIEPLAIIWIILLCVK